MISDLPKAILYVWPASVWSTVPRLCLYEKGYGEDEYILKYVDITKGENFSPSYLKININGTIPTLVVPTLETTGNDVDTRYRSLRDTVTICDFLDQARSAHTHHVNSEKPAPTLSPATIEGKATSDSLIDLIHRPTVDPNFIALAARTPEELKKKAAGGPGQSLSGRRAALKQYLAEAKQAVSDSTVAPKEGQQTFEQRIVSFLEEKIKVNEPVWEIYDGQAGEASSKAFFEVSAKTWSHAIPETLAKIEGIIKGPFAMGDQLSLADLHLVSWLTRIVSIAGGKPDESGITTLEPLLEGYQIGSRLRTFWEEWVKRDSFKKVLVPATSSFAEMT